MIDLRSDTVTKPTPQMRQAMAEAVVGDDVYGEDPTVNALQEKAAALMGKEAALFVPSGTMGNEIAVKVHTRPGDAILIDDQSHILHYELGGPAVLAGVITDTAPCVNGSMPLEEVGWRLRQEDDHTPRTALLCVENTHNRAGGIATSVEQMDALASLAHKKNARMHVDGARIFNAAAAQNVPAARLVQQADSIMFCLSKGLGCPVGSMLAGTKEFIGQAHRVRKLFGGGLRQAGILAAAGLVAFDSMIDRLSDDHRRARQLAEAINEMPGFRVDLDWLHTNLVYIHTEQPALEVERALQEQNVLAIALDPHRLRAVTHNDISDDELEQAIQAFKKAAHR